MQGLVLYNYSNTPEGCLAIIKGYTAFQLTRVRFSRLAPHEQNIPCEGWVNQVKKTNVRLLTSSCPLVFS